MKLKKKTLAMLLALVLVIAAAVGSSLAWLTDTTDPVVNTFTTGDVDIELKETDEPYQMIPGFTIHKDPTVTVSDDSESCYVFVKLEKAIGITEYTFDDYLTYTMADGWIALEKDVEGNPVTGVYYRKVAKDDVTRGFSVLKDDKVSVKDTVTKDMMKIFGDDTTKYPTLTVTAYACQLMKSNNVEFTPAEAWENVKDAIAPTT